MIFPANYVASTEPTTSYVVATNFDPGEVPRLTRNNPALLALLNPWLRTAAGANPTEAAATVTVDLISDLQALVPIPGAAVFVKGRNVVGDGGGGLFYHSNEGEQTDGGTVFAYLGDYTTSSLARTPANLNGSVIGDGNLVFGSVSFALSNGIVLPDLLLHGHRMNTQGVLAGPRINHKTGLVSDLNGSIASRAEAAGVREITIKFNAIGNPRRWVRAASDVLKLAWFHGNPPADPAGDGGHWLAWAFNTASRRGIRTVDLGSKTIRYASPIEIPDGVTLRNGTAKVIDGAGADNVMKALRNDYAGGPLSYVELDYGLGFFPQDGAAFIGLRDFEIDGNFQSNDDCMVNKANYLRQGGIENILQNTPWWGGLNVTNHGHRVISNLRIRLENVHIHHTGSNCLLGNENAWFSGQNVRLGHSLRNHLYYRADGDFWNLELYGQAWATMCKLQAGTFHGLRFMDIVDNPYMPQSNFGLVSVEGRDFGDNSPLRAGQEARASMMIAGLYVDLGSAARLGPALFQGIGDGLRISNGVILGSKAAPAKLFNHLGNGHETGIATGWSFKDILMFQRGYALGIGGPNPVYGNSFNVENIEIKNERGYNTVATTGGPLLTVRSNVRPDPASKLTQNINLQNVQWRNMSGTLGVYAFNFDCLDSNGGKVKISVRDSEVPVTSSAVIRNAKGDGTVSGLTVKEPDKLEIMWENSVVPDNAENKSWPDFELYLLCSRFKGCTTPQGYKTEQSGSVAFTGGGETFRDIETALLWVPKNLTSVMLRPKNAATAAALADAFITFRHRSVDTEIAWGTFEREHPGGDYRSPKIRINFAAPLGSGEAIAFDWSAAVKP